MLMVLLLPLQGYAAAPLCRQHAGTEVADSPTPQHHCPGKDGTAQRHDCGKCCCAAAIDLVAARWTAPHFSAAEITAAPMGHPPDVALDRLDRPPRLAPVPG